MSPILPLRSHAYPPLFDNAIKRMDAPSIQLTARIGLAQRSKFRRYERTFDDCFTPKAFATCEYDKIVINIITRTGKRDVLAYYLVFD